MAHLPAQSRGRRVTENLGGRQHAGAKLCEMLAGSTGLEPAASGVTGRTQPRHIAADPGISGSAAPHLGRPMPIVDACFGTACKFLQNALAFYSLPHSRMP